MMRMFKRNDESELEQTLLTSAGRVNGIKTDVVVVLKTTDNIDRIIQMTY